MINQYAKYDIGVIVEFNYIYHLSYNTDIIDDVMKLFEDDQFHKIITLNPGNENEDIIRIALIKTLQNKYFFSIEIDPIDLWSDSYIKALKEINYNEYNSLNK